MVSRSKKKFCLKIAILSEGQLCKRQTSFAHSACQLGQSRQRQDHAKNTTNGSIFFLNSKNKHADHVVAVVVDDIVAVVVSGSGDVAVGLISFELANVLLSP